MKKPAVVDQFDAFWAIDWSGARSGYRGIAVARLRRGHGMVELLAPPRGGYWTRTAVAERLLAEIRAGRRLLVGFDFAFSLPMTTRKRLGIAAGTGMAALWDRVEALCIGEPDFYAGGFVDAAPSGLFWMRGQRPAGWDGGLRLVDRRARVDPGVTPESALKLIGAKQVGRAALAGMRVLAALRRELGARIAIWPTMRVEPGASVLVEIFPTLFRHRALGRLAKIRDATTLDDALAAFAARAPILPLTALSDDATDALVSVAGMRHYARRADALDPPADPTALDEGWIFGVPV